MLAQNFKTPADLGLNDAEFDALVKVLGMLERGEVQHATSYGEATIPNGFCMNIWGDEDADDPHRCGTVACIGGWAERVGNGVNFQAKALSPELESLFYPGDGDDQVEVDSWDDITTAQAAMALRNYLTTGKSNWREILGEI